MVHDVGREAGRPYTIWSRDGKEIFYRSGPRLLAISVEASPSFSAGKAKVLFEGRYAEAAPGIANYDISPDGRRFLMVEGGSAPAPSSSCSSRTGPRS